VTVLKVRAARERKRRKTGRCEGRKPFEAHPSEIRTLARMRGLRRSRARGTSQPRGDERAVERRRALDAQWAARGAWQRACDPDATLAWAESVSSRLTADKGTKQRLPVRERLPSKCPPGFLAKLHGSERTPQKTSRAQSPSETKAMCQWRPPELAVRLVDRISVRSMPMDRDRIAGRHRSNCPIRGSAGGE
jgi:hypothetical protein